MTASQDRLILWAILALALALRLACLNGPLWFDEVATVDTHLKLPWSEVLSTYSMNHHYLHNIAAKITMAIFGEAPWAIRLPALIFGLLGIAAMWRLAFEVAGRLPAHATALLLALSYHHIWFSTNARGYTGLALFSTLGLLYFLRGLQSGRRRDWLWFAATLAAATFTHLTGAFFFAALGLLWLLLLAVGASGRQIDRALLVEPFLGFLIGGLVTLALYAPLIPSLVAEVGTVSATATTNAIQDYQNPLWTAYEGLRTAFGGAGPVEMAAGALALGLSLIGAVALHRRAPLFALATFGHIILTVLVLLVIGMRIWPRFFFTDIPFVLLLIVVGVQTVCTGMARILPDRLGRLAFPLALAAMCLLSAAMAVRNYEAPKQDLIGAVTAVEAARVGGERVYAISYSGEIFTGHFGVDWATIWTEADYQKALAEPGPVTLVVTFPDRNLREYAAIEADRAAGKLTERGLLPGTLGDGYIVLLHRD